MSVTYTAMLPVRGETVEFLAGLLAAERVQRGTRTNTRSLSCQDQAVLVLRWFLDGWPIWTSGVRPGREHDTTAVHTHSEIQPTLVEAAGDLRTLGDLGYEGESDTITVAFKKPKGGCLTA